MGWGGDGVGVDGGLTLFLLWGLIISHPVNSHGAPDDQINSTDRHDQMEQTRVNKYINTLRDVNNQIGPR